jgi:hypothetical protein
VTLATLSAADARRWLLGLQGLAQDPARKATVPALAALIDQLGFVQLDSIQVVDRAHHLTLQSRLHGYHPDQLTRLLERDRTLFEHWTHDASAIPVQHFAHWKHRFVRDAQRIRKSSWWSGRRGPLMDATSAHIKARIAREGPLRAQDFLPPRAEGPKAKKKEPGGWWNWSAEKAALEWLWRTGELTVVKRVHFQKVYDLTEKVLPDAHALATPEAATHLAWACESALARLGVATAQELAGYWHAVPRQDVARHAAQAVKDGRWVQLSVESAVGPPVKSFAPADWEAQLARVPEAPALTRLLCPFDPVLRDRKRALRRFGFDYRFEAFVPEKKRQYGYYVLPVLEGDALVARVDLKFDREAGALQNKKLVWEPSVKVTRARKQALAHELERLESWLDR